MLATRIFIFQIRLTPMQKIMIEPVRERFARAGSVKKGSTKTASRVTSPWNTPTGMAEKMQPFRHYQDDDKVQDRLRRQDGVISINPVLDGPHHRHCPDAHRQGGGGEGIHK